MYLIKIGGSVITEKSSIATFRPQIMDELAFQLAKVNETFILVHGAGSFGHVLAKKYELTNGLTYHEQRYGFAETQALVQTLNTHVLTALHQYKIPAVSLPPHAFLTFTNRTVETVMMDLFQSYVDKGFIPVTYGDVVLDWKIGFSICSGDLLIWLLAKTFQPKKVIFVIDEDGMYTKNPKMHPDAELVETIKGDDIDTLQTTLDKHADVTQGMAGKLQTIKKITSLHIDTVLVNGLTPNRLYKVLRNQSTPHTIIKG